MNGKINVTFLNTYIEFDKLCCTQFELKRHGATEYINRLIEARTAPGRDVVLPRLVRYRNIRNRIAHEAGAIENITEIKKSDVRWLSDFIKDTSHRMDPLSLYERRIYRYGKLRGKMKIAVGVAAAVLITALVVCFILFAEI